MHLALHLVVLHNFAHELEVLAKFLLSHLAVVPLAIGQVAHNLRKLHFAQLVELFGLEHARLDLADGLRVRPNLCVVQVCLLDALRA